ncbi:MAG: hypothetical protein H8K07_04040 [Nitrospira sp.]|nr:hypothetical protein [Nitrospira sp.]
MQRIWRTRLITILALLVVVGLPACSFVESPPDELLAKNDHVALAAWYQEEAVRLHQKADEMNQMVKIYQRDPERGERMMPHGSRKVDFVQQCKILAAAYISAAREAETLATFHRDMMP